MKKQQEFPRPEVLERDDDKAKSLQISIMRCIRHMVGITGVSLRELIACTGVGDRTLSLRGRNIRIYSLIHLCRFVAHRHNLEMFVRHFLVLFCRCADPDTDMVVRNHRAGEPLQPDEHYLVQHKPRRK